MPQICRAVLQNLPSPAGGWTAFDAAERHPERGGAVVTLVVLAAIVAIAVFVIFFVFGKIVPPNMIGLRQNYFQIPGILEKGYQDKGLAPGLHWKIPGVSTVLLLPRDFQSIQFNNRQLGRGYELPQLEIPTTDGSKVQTDITLLIRFFDSSGKTEGVPSKREKPAKDAKGLPQVPYASYPPREHGGPKQLVNRFTTDAEKQLGTIAKIVEDHLKRSLSTLSTSEYYNPVLRETSAIAANDASNDALNPAGVEVWGTLIRRYVYSEKNIDDQIFAKNLQEQTERLNAMRSQLAEAKAKTERIRAEWDARIKVLKEEGEAKVRVLKAEASRYEQTLVSEGDKLVNIAVAEVEAEKNQAYATPGGDVFVARQLVPLLGTLQGGVVSDIDPYNIGAWVKKLTGAEAPLGVGEVRRAGE